MKRRIASLFMAIAMLLSMCISAVADENEERLIEEVGEEEAIGAERFTDINRSYWAYNEVDGVVRAGLFNGTTRTRFEPYRNMTRAAFVLVLSRLEGLELENQPVDSMRFSDVKTTSRFAAAINWAVENNIVTGYSDGTFRPDRSINRQQIAALVYRWIINRYLPDHPNREVKLADDPVPQFSDYSDVSTTSDFREALNYCRLHGLINGYSNGTFRPYTRINRGQMAAILYRIILVITGGETEDYLVIVDPSSQVHGETDWSASRDGKAVAKGDIEPGDTITILKNPDDRYVVTNVRVVDALGKRVTVKNRTTFVLPAADRLPATIYVTYSRSGSGGGGGGGGGGGDTEVVNAYNLTLNAAGTGTGTVTLTASSATANYGRLSVSPTGSDTLSSVPENQEVRFFVDPTNNSTFTVAGTYAATINGTATNQPLTVSSTTPGLYTFTMPAGNVTITVTFAPATAYDLTLAVVSSNGATGSASLTAAAGQQITGVTVGQTQTIQSVQAGQTVTVTTAPDAGSNVESVVVDVNGVTVTNTGTNQYTFTMPSGAATVTVTLVKEPVQPTVEVVVEGTGTVSVTKNGAEFATTTKAAEKVAEGDAFSITWTETGEEIESITVDGAAQDISKQQHQAGTGTFADVLTIAAGDKAAHVIKIVFVDVRYQFSIKAQLGNSHEVELKTTTLKGSNLLVAAAKDLAEDDTLNEAVDNNKTNLQAEIERLKNHFGNGFTLNNIAINRNDPSVVNSIKTQLKNTTVALPADYDTQIKTRIANELNTRYAAQLNAAGITLTANNITLNTSASNAVAVGLTDNGVDTIYNAIDWNKFRADGNGNITYSGASQNIMKITATASFSGLALNGGSVNGVEVQPRLINTSQPLTATVTGVNVPGVDIPAQAITTFPVVTTSINSNQLPASVQGATLPLSDLFLKSYASLMDDIFAQATTDATIQSVLADFPNTKSEIDTIYNGSASSVNDAYFTVVKDNTGHVSAIGVNGTAVLEEDVDKGIMILLDVDRLLTLYVNTIDKVNGIRLDFLGEAESDSAAKTAVRAGIRVVSSKKEALAKLNDYANEIAELAIKRDPTVKDAYYGLKGTDFSYSMSRELPGSAKTVLQSLGLGSNVKVTVTFTRTVQ